MSFRNNFKFRNYFACETCSDEFSLKHALPLLPTSPSQLQVTCIHQSRLTVYLPDSLDLDALPIDYFLNKRR